MTTETEPSSTTTVGATSDGAVSSDTHRSRSWRRFIVEAVIGVSIAAAIIIAVLTSTGEIPFVYQGY